MSKQDRQGVRTAADLEWKYQFGKRFAEVMGIATDAQDAANRATEGIDGLDQKLDHNEIFNRLTNNGQLQGLYRGDDGELYINAAYIKSLESLFANDIYMTGQFESVSETYLPPTHESLAHMLYYLSFPGMFPPKEGYEDGYDLDGDGKITLLDVQMAKEVFRGTRAMQDCPGAKKSQTTIRINMSDPEKLIHIFGINQWGYEVEVFIGSNARACSFASRDHVDRMINQEVDGDILYRVVGGSLEYINPPMEAGIEYRTADRYNGKVVYKQLVSFGQMPNASYGWKELPGVDETKVIRLEGRCYRAGDWNSFPVFLSGSLAAYCWVDETGIGVNAISDLSAYNAEFIITYYKD